MKYKYIPKPELEKGQEAKTHHDLIDGVFVTGWEVGHYNEIPDPDLSKDVEPRKEWVVDYYAMELSPEQEAEWEYEQAHPVPTQADRIEAQVLYTALMTDTLIEGE